MLWRIDSISFGFTVRAYFCRIPNHVGRGLPSRKRPSGRVSMTGPDGPSIVAFMPSVNRNAVMPSTANGSRPSKNRQLHPQQPHQAVHQEHLLRPVEILDVERALAQLSSFDHPAPRGSGQATLAHRRGVEDSVQPEREVAAAPFAEPAVLIQEQGFPGSLGLRTGEGEVVGLVGGEGLQAGERAFRVDAEIGQENGGDALAVVLFARGLIGEGLDPESRLAGRSARCDQAQAGGRAGCSGCGLGDLPFEPFAVFGDLEGDPGQRGEQAVEMRGDVAGFPLVDAERLEETVAGAEGRVAQPNSSLPIAVRNAAALASLSSRSRSGSESAVIPHPAWYATLPRAATAVRMATARSRSPFSEIQPNAPMAGPLRRSSSAAITLIARIFGAPLIEAAGNVARSSSAGPTSGRSSPRTVATRWWTVGSVTSRARSDVSIEPGAATRPRSLRATSTIIASSARSFLLSRSSRARARSSAGFAPRRRVPLIGRVSADRPRTERKISGEIESSARPCPRSKKAPRTAGLAARRRQ